MNRAEEIIRQRFVEEIDQPFCVVAPAGSGKTHAIVHRLKNLLLKSNRSIALVTYTNKAAEEMRLRLEKEMGESPFNRERLFVGTIHSLCSELLRRNATQWNVPVDFQILNNPALYEGEFRSECPNPLDNLAPEVAEIFEKHFELKDFNLEFLSKLPKTIVYPEKLNPPAQLPLSSASWKDKPERKSAGYAYLQSWIHRYIEKGGWKSDFRVPDYPEAKGAQELYQGVFGGYQKWKQDTGLYFAKKLSERFAAWRLERGLLSYDDLIDLTLTNLKEQSGSLCVVLDEAQDASPEQLGVLLKLAGKVGGKTDLTMVGDPQQSIYSERASLSFYRKTIEDLVASHGAELITFETTFRCSRAIVDFVNQLGPKLLRGGFNQAQYVPLTPKDEALEGCVGRWELGSAPEGKGVLHNFEAKSIAKKIKQFLKEDYTNAHEVAILCSRKTEDWLQLLEAALKSEKIPCQFHDNSQPSVPKRLLRAITHLITYPFDRFEVLGLLRELYPIPDPTLSEEFKKLPNTFSLASLSALENIDNPQLKEALKKLSEACMAARSAPAHRSLDIFCQKISLAEKLAQLEGIIGTHLLADYERVLASINSRIGKSATLAAAGDFAEENSTEVKPGHVQLLTIHKAKGLEWEVVILPYLFRTISAKPRDYPVLQKPAEGSAYLAFESESIDSQSAYEAEKGELERLFYVALTRPRHTLILVDDSLTYAQPPKEEKKKPEAKKTIPRPTPAELCHFNETGEFYSLFKNISEPSAHFPPARKNPLVINVSEELTLPSRPLRPRITPSSRAIAPQEHTHRAEGGSTFGSFWHDLWATITPESDIKATLLEALPRFPNHDRAQTEINKFFQTPLPGFLASHTFWTEVPLLCALPEGVIEGRLDLVAQTPQGLFLLDWKTDHLPLPLLWETYAPQLSAYKRSLETLEGRPVRAALYSTVYATLLEYAEGGGYKIITEI